MHSRKFQDQCINLAPRLYRIAFAILTNSQDAEDAVQDTYLKLWKITDRLELMENPEAFFATTVRNTCLNMLRLRRQEEQLEYMENIPDTADRTGEVKERGLWHRLLDRLNSQTKRIVVLRHVGEYSTRDIAEMTGETEANVRTLLYRGRRKLKEDYLRTQNTKTTYISHH